MVAAAMMQLETRDAKACYRSGSSTVPEALLVWVRSPSGANFSSGVKKTPSLVPRPKHCRAQPNSQSDGPRIRVRQGFGNFVNLL